jgi:hypothetical protein
MDADEKLAKPSGDPTTSTLVEEIILMLLVLTMLKDPAALDTSAPGMVRDPSVANTH